MFERIINYSIRNKLIVLLFTSLIIGSGVYSLMNIPIGAVPDITDNQVQVITTSRNLATQDVEKFLTTPVELEMANLPNVKEIRSVSKFGLSVVTIFFDEEIGTYLPRQLIAEKIKSAEEMTSFMLNPGMQFAIVVIMSLIFNFLLGLIVAAVVKREKPIFE